MRIGLVDVDLLDGGTRFPNLALMKLSGYYKRLGHIVELLDYYNPDIEKIFVSKVFSKSIVPGWVNFYTDATFGGTGFDLYNAPRLSDDIEHTFPDYALYDDYIAKHYDKRIARRFFNEYYTDSSIGFTTRGCIRGCPFCVNRDKRYVEKWSSVSEFYDPTRKYVVLLDDNIFAFPEWEYVFDDLDETQKAIRFIQGLDVRLMSKRKAERLSYIHYHKSVCFAFDNIVDRKIIERGLNIYRSECENKQTLAYVLVGFYKNGEEELCDAFDRIDILTQYNIDPYIMKHENFRRDPFSNIYIELARWANQPSFRRMTFGEFFEKNASKKARIQAEMISSILRSRLFKTIRRQ